MPGTHIKWKKHKNRHLYLSEDTMKNMLLCIVGIACACLFANMTKQTMFRTAPDTLKHITKNLSEKNLPMSEVTLYSFTNNCKLALLLFFFSFTNVWKLYSRCFVFYIGFLQGILLSCCLFLKGFSGIFLYATFQIPHIFLLAPLFLFLLHRLECWHNDFLYPSPESQAEPDSPFPQKKKQMILQILPLFFITIILLLLGAFLEGYLNVALLRLYK